MKLAAVSDIREELGFDDMADINSVIEESLHAATSQIESILNTTFEAGTISDIFFVDEPGFITANGAVNITEFRLSKGLVTSLTGAAYASNYANVLSGDDNTSLLTAGLLLNGVIGKITDPSTVYANSFVKFTYDYGIAVDTLDSTSYLLTAVPKWLSLAAKARAKAIIKDSPAVTTAQIHLDPVVLDAEFKNLIGTRLRYIPMGKIPL